MRISTHKSEPAGIEKASRIYAVGTLQYNLRGLFVLFAWLLWGDFAFCFFESIFGRFIPLYVKDFHGSNTLIGIMMGSIAGGINLIFLPGLSQWSDEYRSRWGRRIPFLAVVTPLTVAAVILLGFAPEIAGVVHSRVIHPIAPGVSLSAVILCMISGFVVAFHYLNMVLVNAYNWLQRDVVPQVVMARFLSWFRIVSTMSAALFNWYVFPYIIDYRKPICVGIGLFYLITFLLMCLKVKEGEYPPPPTRKDKPNPFKSYFITYGRYLKTCLSVPIYRNSFIASAFVGMAICSGGFYMFFQLDTLGVSMADLGKISAIFGIASAVLYAPAGWACDKFSPFRVALVTGPLGLLLGIFNFLYNHNEHTLIVFTILGTLVGVPAGLAASTIAMELYPTEKFGQFSAANTLFVCGIAILGNYLFGVYMDMAHSNYRMIFLWNVLWGLLSYLFYLLVYRDWKRFGGPDNYVAPLPPE